MNPLGVIATLSYEIISCPFHPSTATATAITAAAAASFFNKFIFIFSFVEFHIKKMQIAQ